MSSILSRLGVLPGVPGGVPMLPGAAFHHPPEGVEPPAELAAPIVEPNTLYARQAALLAERQQLLDERPSIDERDRLALGHALVTEKPEPPRLLPDHDAALELAAARLAAVQGVIDMKVGEIHALIAKRRPGWAKAMTRQIDAEQRRYEQALAAVVECPTMT